MRYKKKRKESEKKKTMKSVCFTRTVLSKELQNILTSCDLKNSKISLNLVGKMGGESASLQVLGDSMIKEKIGLFIKIYDNAFALDPKKTNNLLVEELIFEDGINALQTATPHIVQFFGSKQCDRTMKEMIKMFQDDQSEISELMREIQAGGKASLIVTEKLDSSEWIPFSKIGDVIKTKTENQKLQIANAILFQLFWTLMCLNKMGINHNDLHGNNFWIKFLPENEIKTIDYVLEDDDTYFTRKDPVLVKIIDFDQATWVDVKAEKEDDPQRGTPILVNTFFQKKELEDQEETESINQEILTDLNLRKSSSSSNQSSDIQSRSSSRSSIEKSKSYEFSRSKNYSQSQSSDGSKSSQNENSYASRTGSILTSVDKYNGRLTFQDIYSIWKKLKSTFGEILNLKPLDRLLSVDPASSFFKLTPGDYESFMEFSNIQSEQDPFNLQLSQYLLYNRMLPSVAILTENIDPSAFLKAYLVKTFQINTNFNSVKSSCYFTEPNFQIIDDAKNKAEKAFQERYLKFNQKK